MSTKSALRADLDAEDRKTLAEDESEWCAARGPSCLVMIVLICCRLVEGHEVISIVRNT
jgi:hypothetical protein